MGVCKYIYSKAVIVNLSSIEYLEFLTVLIWKSRCDIPNSNIQVDIFVCYLYVND